MTNALNLLSESNTERMTQPRVLIIDDSPTMRLIARRGFERAGLKVYDTDDVGHAIKFVIRKRPDVVLVDLFIPSFPTKEFIAQLREIREERSLALDILIYSGRSSEELRELSAEYGADGYIQKMRGIRTCIGEVVSRIRSCAGADKQEERGS